MGTSPTSRMRFLFRPGSGIGTAANLWAASVGTDRAIAWNGILAGTFDVAGVIGQDAATVQANLAIAPVALLVASNRKRRWMPWPIWTC